MAPHGSGEREEENLLVFVVAPVAGGMLFVAIVGLLVFLNMARRKRSHHGTYNPQKQVMLPVHVSFATIILLLLKDANVKFVYFRSLQHLDWN